MTKLAVGTTDSHGFFTAAVDTSSIPSADMGDIGAGMPDAFNAEIEAIDRSGNFAVMSAVLTVGSSCSRTVRVNVPAPLGASLAQKAPRLSGRDTVLGHAFRYTPVTPLNSAAGIKVVLKYTTDASTSRQTEVTEADIGSNGGVSVGVYQLEQHSRSIVSPFTKSGNYHWWVWANYEYKKYKICGSNCGGGTTIEWKPYEFTGQAITDKNPNKKKGKVIGKVRYPVPPFTPGSSNQNWFVLTQTNSGWSRSSGTREANGLNGKFILPAASSIGLSSLTTYGSITSVTYGWVPTAHCGPGHARVIWGHNATPADATRVQANCLPTSVL